MRRRYLTFSRLESGSFLLASVLDAHQFKALAVQVTIWREKDLRTKALWGIAQHSAPRPRHRHS
jgi:hypothetical protein